VRVQKLAERDQVGIGGLVEPLATYDQLIPEVSQMGYGPPKDVRPSFRNAVKTSPTWPLDASWLIDRSGGRLSSFYHRNAISAAIGSIFA
jgi:hypothetical protein